MRGEFAKDLTVPHIWKKIQVHCDYNIQQLLEDLESKFDENMNWGNHGQVGTTRKKGEFCWHIDHVIPRSQFYYTDLDDPQFANCWSLDNLQPLEWSENIRKGG